MDWWILHGKEEAAFIRLAAKRVKPYLPDVSPSIFALDLTVEDRMRLPES